MKDKTNYYQHPSIESRRYRFFVPFRHLQQIYPVLVIQTRPAGVLVIVENKQFKCLAVGYKYVQMTDAWLVEIKRSRVAL